MQPRVAPRQLALALSHTESFAREDFLPGPCNEASLALIERWPDWPARVVALIGPRGSGKSHLAAIWASTTGARFLAGRALGETHLPSALATGALVLEDVADQLDERALFHLINLAREHEAYVLLTAPRAPATWTVGLADLASRLRAIPAVMLSPPDDVLLRAVLVKLFADRQIKTNESLVTYLLARLERSFAAARAAVDAIDREALRRKRPVTQALAADVLEVQWELGLSGGESDAP
jgi:chromosomal replication initiation ATPase DnaA